MNPIHRSLTILAALLSGLGIVSAAEFSVILQDSVTAAPISGVRIYVHSVGGGLNQGFTDEDGKIVLSLDAGDYYLKTRYAKLQGYIDEWHDGLVAYDNANSRDDIALFSLDIDSTESFVWNLDRGAEIRGTFTDPEGNPVKTMQQAFLEHDYPGTVSRESANLHTGAYTLRGLPPGTYVLRSERLSFPLLNVWLGGRIGTIDDLNELPDGPGITRVTITGTETVTVENVVIPAAGIITGTLREPNGDPIAGCRVRAQSFREDGEFDPNLWFSTNSDSNGVYRIDRLTPGTYGVISDCYESNYLDLWVGGARARVEVLTNGVTRFTVSENSEIYEDVDLTLSQGGILSGQVTDEAGNPLEDIRVYAIEVADETRHRSITGADGTYRIEGIPSDAVVVVADGYYSGFGTKWFDDVLGTRFHHPAPAAARQLMLATGQEESGLDFALPRTSGLDVRVETAAGTTVSQQGVDLYEASGSRYSHNDSGSTGWASFEDVPAGDWYLLFSEGSDRFFSTWHDGTRKVADPPDPIADGVTPFQVEPEEQKQITFVPVEMARLSGVVKNTDDSPADGATVQVFHTDGSLIAEQASDANGAFFFSGLDPMEVHVVARRGSEGIWYGQVVDGGGGPADNSAPRLELPGRVETSIELRFDRALEAVDLSGITFSSGIRLAWTAVLGERYEVQWCADLRTADWSRAPTGNETINQSLRTANINGILEYEFPVGHPAAAFRIMTVP